MQISIDKKIGGHSSRSYEYLKISLHPNAKDYCFDRESLTKKSVECYLFDDSDVISLIEQIVNRLLNEHEQGCSNNVAENPSRP